MSEEPEKTPENAKEINEKIDNNNNNENNQISIDNFLQNPNQALEIDSPRSLESIKLLGYTNEDINYMTLKQFINNNPNLIPLAPELQKRRYECYEQNRLNKIQNIAELREKLTESYFIETYPELFNNNENNVDDGLENINSTAIEQEKKNFERIKKKNEMDLLNSVTYELEKQVMKKEAERKFRKQDMKNENFRRNNELKAKMEKIKSDEREYKKFLQNQQIEEQRKKDDLDRYLNV